MPKQELSNEERLIKALRNQNDLLRQIKILLAMQVTEEEKIVQIKAPSYRASMVLPDLRVDHIQQKIFETSNFYEIELLEAVARRLPDAPTIIDVGANIGNHTVYFAVAANAKKIICFEPQSYMVELLKKNVNKNDLNDIVTIHQMGLSGQDGYLSQKGGFSPTNYGGTQFEVTDDPGGMVCRRMDSVIDEPMDFIKIDVEHMEHEVLDGAWPLIEKYRPLVWVEAVVGSQSHKRLCDRFGRLNYTWELLPRTQKNHLFYPQ